MACCNKQLKGQSRDPYRVQKIAMHLSLITAIFILMIKAGAYVLTGSSAILGDMAESIIHIAAVGLASYSLRLSLKPPNKKYPYGYSKISFFSAGFEGSLIIFAAFFIIYDAINKWLQGLTLEHLGYGTVLTALALFINGSLGIYLIWVGKQKKSLILEANGKHTLTDAWTSLGVVIGLLLTLWTGWLPFDPICAIFVALNILYSGAGLIRQSFTGLMDTASPDIQQKLDDVLKEEIADLPMAYHQLRHRHLGHGYWVDLHLLFKDETPVFEAHRKATQIENAIRSALGKETLVTTHLEPIQEHKEMPDHC